MATVSASKMLLVTQCGGNSDMYLSPHALQMTLILHNVGEILECACESVLLCLDMNYAVGGIYRDLSWVGRIVVAKLYSCGTLAIYGGP